ncbi:MAG TPA: isoamylase early set domain-containing protein [Flavisolibacter sp.]|jgi:1,4-alpha-glucan branching enzyme|nr:isoamylase early set domain-containing protein [Flavisolibacter sp.]
MIEKTYFKTKDYCKVKFSLKPEQAQSVAIAGLNNDWKTLIYLSRKKDGSFSADVSLPKGGQHEFRYLVNESEWVNEPDADAHQENIFGTTNSVIVL